MTGSRRHSGAALGSLLLLAACGGTPETDNGSVPTPPPTASDYCETVVDAYCDFYVRCGRMAVTTTAACRDAFLESCNGLYEPRYVDLETAGLLTLAADGVRACAEHLGSVACEAQLRDLDGPCGTMWRGTQPAEAPCGFDVESLVCDAGSVCVLGLDLCGTCRAAAAVGEACGGGTPCQSGLDCVADRCVARALASEPCDATTPCVIGASCVDGTCVGPAYVGVGDSCDGSHRCPYLTFCIGGRCELGARLDAACGPSVPCVSGQCLQGVCVPRSDDGAPCSSGSQCQSSLCEGGLCAPLPSACF